MRHVILLFLLLPTLLCADETEPWVDLVWLTTGDRVSGEIIKLEAKKLTLKTKFAGSIKVDWTMVERIESERTFAVELSSGLQIEGTVQRTENEVRIVTATDEQIVAPGELRQIERTGESKNFWDVADLTIGLGANITGGNSILRQNSLDAAFRHRTAKRKITVDVRSIVSKEETSERISRNEGIFRLDRYLNKDMFAYVVTAFESDEKSLLDLRLTAGGGLGWQLKKTSTEDLSLRGGFNVINERFGADEGNPAVRDTSMESMFGMEAHKVTRRNITLYAKTYAHPSLQQGRYRLTGDAGVRIPVFGFMIWSLSGFDRFDSAPPTDKKRNDFGIVTSFGFSF
jgi:uncharacterized protein DUF481